MLSDPNWTRRIDRRHADRRAACLLRCCCYAWIGLLLLVLLVFALLQTPSVQRWTLEKCDLVRHGENKELGMPLEYDRITGIFPARFTMHELEFIDPVGRVVQVDRARIGFELTSPLLAGEIRVTDMHVNHARMSPMVKHEELRDNKRVPPWPSAVLGLRILNTTWEQLVVESMGFTLRIDGELDMRPGGGDIRGSATFRQVDVDAARQLKERQRERERQGKRVLRDQVAPTRGAWVQLTMHGDHGIERVNVQGTAHQLSASWRGARCSVPQTLFGVDGSWEAWELLSFPVVDTFPRDDLALNFSMRALACAPDDQPAVDARGAPRLSDPKQLFGDYADYMPRELHATALMDERRNLDVRHVAVRGATYAMEGPGYWQDAAHFSAKLGVRHSTLREGGSELRLDQSGGSLRLESRAAVFMDREATLEARFDYPDESTGEAELREVELDLGAGEVLRGSFVVHTPRAMRRMGAAQDVLVLEGVLSGSGASDFTVQMQADANFEQQLQLQALVRNLTLHQDGSRVGEAALSASLTRFPFDAHGTLDAVLWDLWTPRVDAATAFLRARRDSPGEARARLHPLPLAQRHTRTQQQQDPLRSWSLELHSEGGERLASLDASAEVLMEGPTLSADLHPSRAVYQALSAWTNETAYGAFDWRTGAHMAQAALHTLDSNGTRGNITLEVRGDWNATNVQTRFCHSLSTLSDLRLVRQRFQGQTNGTLRVSQDAQGNVSVTGGAFSLREFTLYQSDTHPLPLLANASLEMESGEEGWRLLHLEALLPTYEGSMRGSGRFGPPRLNQGLVDVDVVLELRNVSYVQQGNVTMRGEMKMFIP